MTHPDVRELVALAQAGDHKARDELLHRYERTVSYQCRKVARQWGIDADDAEQEARLAVVDAIGKFDLDYEGFSSLNAYVTASVRRAALKQVQYRDAVNRPGNAAVDASTLSTATRRLRAKGVPATPENLATELRWTPARVDKAERIMTPGTMVSLDASLGEDEDGESRTRYDIVPSPGPSPEDRAQQVIDTERLGARLGKAMAACLTPGEVEAVQEHLMRGRLLRDVAERRGVTHQAIALQVKRGLQKLREALLAEGVTASSELLPS